MLNTPTTPAPQPRFEDVPRTVVSPATGETPAVAPSLLAAISEAYRAGETTTTMPQPGDRFLGFHLLDVLGRGAFGTVFLAKQGELANRLVALKVSTRLMDESQTLAQLQHTNIVPIYSYHFAGPCHAVCMPFLGANTLADVLRVAESRGGLPLSGKELVSTLNERKRSTSTRSSKPAPSDKPGSEPPGEPASPLVSPIASQNLEGRSYVSAVLWLAAQLADGLAHAHERGILHRDLKPANILLADDGQPLLLDFNLSANVKADGGAAAASVGGTLPYMAPEHLEAFGGGKRIVDGRSDVYSFGVILYELLTLRPPFAMPKGPRHEQLRQMIEERERGAPALRRWNPLVPAAVESIVRHCLEPNPERRYQSARQLQEDLERHEQNLPLRYAPESWRERARKWLRRHPRLTSATSVAALAGILLIGAVMAASGFEQRASRLEAKRNLATFHHDAAAVTYLLNAENTSNYLAEGVRKGESLADRYGARTDPAWRDRRGVRLLDADERRRLEEELGQLLLLMSRAKMQQAEGRPAEERAALLRDADADCSRAATFFEPERRPLSLDAQQSELKRRLQGDESARPSSDHIEPRTSIDCYLAATEEAQQRKNNAALKWLDEGLRLDPADYNLHLLQGNCLVRLDREAEALGAYQTCIALRPDSPFAYFNRGLVRLKRKEFDKAKADFDEAIRLPSDSEQFLADAHVNRALALQGLERHKEALADVTRALEIGSTRSRLHFVRQRLYEKLGDKDAAKAAYEEGLKAAPHDELDWNARGLARLPGDPRAALADFDKALECNPRYFPALQNKAFVLGAHLKRVADAVVILDEAVRCAPEDARPVAGRGVYLARLGQRDAALRDAEAALRLDDASSNVYQVAGIYALTSKTNPDDKQAAFRLLAQALRKGFGFEYLERDRDLDPIRQEPQFVRLVEAARAVQAKP